MFENLPVRVVLVLAGRAIIQDRNGKHRVVSLELFACATVGDDIIVAGGHALRKAEEADFALLPPNLREVPTPEANTSLLAMESLASLALAS